MNLDTGQTFQPDAAGPVYDPAGNTATWTFADLLPEGNYRATILADGLVDPTGTPIAADYGFDFHVLRGDANGDRQVDVMDYVALKSAYGATEGAGWDNADFDGDGDVDRADLLAMKADFGRSLGPPPEEVGQLSELPEEVGQLSELPEKVGQLSELPPTSGCEAPSGADTLLVASVAAVLEDGPYGPTTNLLAGAVLPSARATPIQRPSQLLGRSGPAVRLPRPALHLPAGRAVGGFSPSQALPRAHLEVLEVGEAAEGAGLAGRVVRPLAMEDALRLATLSDPWARVSPRPLRC